MKTDENYIYPTTPEELSMFYGWDNVEELTENDDDELDWFRTDEPWVESFHISEMETDYPHEYRIKLPTVNDLKVGDVVRYTDVESEVKFFDIMTNKEVLDELVFGIDQGMAENISLLISRNTWVKVKV